MFKYDTKLVETLVIFEASCSCLMMYSFFFEVFGQCCHLVDKLILAKKKKKNQGSQVHDLSAQSACCTMLMIKCTSHAMFAKAQSILYFLCVL